MQSYIKNHKLEIIDSDIYQHGCRTRVTYNIFNDATKKLITWTRTRWNNVDDDLLYVLDFLLEKNSETEDFFEADSTLKNFNTITKSLKQNV